MIEQLDGSAGLSPRLADLSRQRGRPGSFLRCLLHLRQLERRNRRSRIGNVIFQKPFPPPFPAFETITDDTVEKGFPLNPFIKKS